MEERDGHETVPMPPARRTRHCTIINSKIINSQKLKLGGSSGMCNSGCDVCSIFESLAAIDPFDLICFAENRVQRKEVSFLLPELSVWQQFIEPEFIQGLCLEMEAHNKTVRRGIKMELIDRLAISNLIFSSLPHFALQMQTSKVTQAINALCAFGERITPTVSASPDALFFYIYDTLVIKRDVWFGLCLHMLSIVDSLNRVLCPGSTGCCNYWPDRHLLELACVRIIASFRSPASISPDILSSNSTPVLPLRPQLRELLNGGGSVKSIRCKRRRLR